MVETVKVIEIDFDGVLYSICGAMREENMTLELVDFSENSLKCYDLSQTPPHIYREICKELEEPQTYNKFDYLFPETRYFLMAMYNLAEHYDYRIEVNTWLPPDAPKEIVEARREILEDRRVNMFGRIGTNITQTPGGKTWEERKPFILIEDNPSPFLKDEKICEIGIMRKWRYNTIESEICAHEKVFYTIAAPTCDGQDKKNITAVGSDSRLFMADGLREIYEACAYALATTAEGKTVDWRKYYLERKNDIAQEKKWNEKTHTHPKRCSSFL